MDLKVEKFFKEVEIKIDQSNAQLKAQLKERLDRYKKDKAIINFITNGTSKTFVAKDGADTQSTENLKIYSKLRRFKRFLKDVGMDDANDVAEKLRGNSIKVDKPMILFRNYDKILESYNYSKLKRMQIKIAKFFAMYYHTTLLVKEEKQVKRFGINDDRAYHYKANETVMLYDAFEVPLTGLLVDQNMKISDIDMRFQDELNKVIKEFNRKLKEQGIENNKFVSNNYNFCLLILGILCPPLKWKFKKTNIENLEKEFTDSKTPFTRQNYTCVEFTASVVDIALHRLNKQLKQQNGGKSDVIKRLVDDNLDLRFISPADYFEKCLSKYESKKHHFDLGSTSSS